MFNNTMVGKYRWIFSFVGIILEEDEIGFVVVLKSHFMGQFCIRTVSDQFSKLATLDYTLERDQRDLTKLNRSSFNGVSLNMGRNRLLYISRRKRFRQLVFLISLSSN